MKRLNMLVARFPVLALGLAAAAACTGGATTAATQAAEPPAQALRGMRIYTSPGDPPIDDGVVLVRGGRVVAVGTAREMPQAQGAPALAPQCDGGVVLAGFQNSHVHLLGPAFADARTAPARQLERGLEALLTRHGFTTAFDIASDRDNTLALRRRVEQGEVKGPRLLTVGLPLFPHQGLPIYLDHFDRSFLDKLPQPDSVASASATVRQNLDAGADGTKLFLVTPQGRQSPKRMHADIAAAASALTHRQGKLVFAHPTDLRGVEAALQAKVDILAHPPLGTPAPWPPALMQRLRDAGVHLIPTLKLLRHELAKEGVPEAPAGAILRDSVQEVGRFAAAGGKILFGTDVDYMTDLDPAEEYRLMAQAGMDPMQILASLTTTPAARWNEAHRRGRIAAGMDADLVVLDADPGRDVEHFARVKCTLRAGHLLFARPSNAPSAPR